MMSPNKSKKVAEAIRDPSPEPGPSSSKRPRSKIVTSSDEEEETVPRKAVTSKYGSKFIRSPGFTSHNKPAELFRKDLISAMKMADSEQLLEGSYIVIADPWRQEWEKGVQVPVNQSEIMHADITEIHEKSKTGDFKIHGDDSTAEAVRLLQQRLQHQRHPDLRQQRQPQHLHTDPRQHGARL